MWNLDHRWFLAQDYALLNPLQIARDQYSDLSTFRLMPSGFERHARMMPLLVTFNTMSEAHRLDLLERAQRWSGYHDLPLFCALLSSDADESTVKASLQRNMIVRRGNGRQVWLRQHDPRVFRHLCWLFDDAQMASLMGPVTSWTWLDPLAGHWHAYTCNEKAYATHLRLTPDQWVAVDELEALNRCLRTLAQTSSAVLDDGIARQLLQSLVEARRQGFDDMAQRCLYAHRQLQDTPHLAPRGTASQFRVPRWQSPEAYTVSSELRSDTPPKEGPYPKDSRS